MAERRMFSKAITDTDAFLEMPLSTQALYFHLAMHADDEGFVSSPKRILRETKANEDDFKLLIVKRFILTFDTGIIVIKHWKIHNLIQKDRFKETTYLEEKATLALDRKNAYVERVDTECIQSGNKPLPQIRDFIDEGYYCVKIRCSYTNEIVSYFTIDKSAPIINAYDEYTNSTFTMTAQDKYSAVVAWEYRFDDGEVLRHEGESITLGGDFVNGVWSVRAFDSAGNATAWVTVKCVYREHFGNVDKIYNSFFVPS